VVAAGPPVARPPLARTAPILERLLACLKHLAALEPHNGGVRLFALQLFERRQQVFPVAPAKRGRLSARDDGPVSGP
jgi:hypothetical protein